MTNASSISLVFRNIALVLVCSYLLFNCSNAISKNAVSGDGILSIPQTNSLKAKALVWKYNGTLVYLDATFKPVKTTKLKVSAISRIVQYSKGLLVIGGIAKRNENTTYIVLNIGADGEVRNTWASDTFMFWSVAYDKGKYLATTDSGDLLDLKPGNTYKVIEKYPRTSIYISVPKQDNIICIGPNLTKLHYAPAKCQRKGPNKWEAIGQWRDVLRPFRCGNYLIGATGNWIDANVWQLLARDIKTGKKVTQKSLRAIKTAGCVDDKVLYIDNKINIAELPTLETVSTSECGGPKPRSASLVDGRVVCLDKNGRFHTDKK